MSDPHEFSLRSIPTPHGTVAVTISETAPPRPSQPGPSNELTLLLLHSNSASSRAFRHILSRPPPGVRRVVAMDYPGHGQSPDATGDVDRAYTMRGYADCGVAVLRALGATDAVIFGWSLGGHTAIEMVPLLAEAGSATRCRGIMITGTPPCLGAEQVAAGFDASGNQPETETKAEAEAWRSADGSDVPLGAKETWAEGDCERFVSLVYSGPLEPWMFEDGKRTVGKSRRIMFGALGAGSGVDQRRVVETSDVPCAVVNGAHETFVNLGYVDGISYKNLWEGKCHRMPGLGHAPFWEKPDLFQEYLWRFVKDCQAKV